MDLEDDGPDHLTDLASLLAGDKPKDGNEGGTPGEGEGGEDPGEPDAGDGEGGDDNPDEGTDTEGAGEGGEQPEGDGTEEPSTEPFYTVKVDGKDVRITLKEALAGYQRQEDYTRKTTELAEARKGVDTEIGQARQARDQYAAVLKLVMERLGPADQEPTADQWNALRQADPARYATEYADFQRRQDQRRAVQTEQERVTNENRAQDLQKARTFLDGERLKLHKAIPILADKEKGPAEMRALREYAAKTFGFSEQEMDQAYDHRMIVAIDKARKWDAHAAALAKAKNKVETAPALPAPGNRVPGRTNKQAARAALQKQFDKTGDPEDAAALLIAG